MPSASFLFLLFLYFRKSLLEIFSELDASLRNFFMRNKTPEDQRAAGGATHRAQAPPCRGPQGTREWGPPLPCGHLLGPLQRL